MDIRLLQSDDLPLIQHANIENLPENYFLKYYLYHALSWPQLSFVAVDVSRPSRLPYDRPKIVGYVLAKMDEEPADGIPQGHITSLSVMRTHRRLGIAEKLMKQSQLAMVETYGAQSVSLNVRVSNVAAIRLYRDKLGFTQEKQSKSYYADGEDSFVMKCGLDAIRARVNEEREQEQQLKGLAGRKNGPTQSKPEGNKVDSHKVSKTEDQYDDDGDSVGDVGKALSEVELHNKKRKVKVGRALGVGELVELVEKVAAKQ